MTTAKSSGRRAAQPNDGVQLKDGIQLEERNSPDRGTSRDRRRCGRRRRVEVELRDFRRSVSLSLTLTTFFWCSDRRWATVAGIGGG